MQHTFCQGLAKAGHSCFRKILIEMVQDVKTTPQLSEKGRREEGRREEGGGKEEEEGEGRKDRKETRGRERGGRREVTQ